MRHTYWFSCPRGFGNQYEIGIASSAGHAKAYKDAGYERINRDQAIRDMTYRGDAATQAYVTVSVDGKQHMDRFDAARDVRNGKTPCWVYDWDED